MATVTAAPQPDGSLIVTVTIPPTELPSSAQVLNQLSNLGSELSNALGAIHNAAASLETHASATADALAAQAAALQPAEPAA